jgi:site-specific DNA recombinase
MTNAAAYTRYSASSQKAASIEIQFAEICKFAAEKDLDIVAEYQDEAKSASDFATKQRDNFERMLSDIESGKITIQAVIFYDPDRFSRNERDFARAKYIFRRHNIKWYYVTVSVPDGPSGIYVEKMFEAYSIYYSHQLSLRVTKGLSKNFEEGLHRGGKTALGYRVEPGTLKYQIDPAEELLVLKMQKMMIEGNGCQVIAQSIGSVRGHRIYAEYVRHVLHNPIYRGLYPNVPGIGRLEDWEEVDRVIGDRKARYRPNTNRGPDQIWILRGKVKCEICGSPVVGFSGMGGRGNKYPYSYYRCRSGRTKGGFCGNPGIKKVVFENHILDQLEGMFAPVAVNDLIDTFIESQAAKNQDSTIEAIGLQKEIDDCKVKIGRLVDSITAGVDPRDIADKMKELKSKQGAAELKLKKLNRPAPVDREKARKDIEKNRHLIGNRADLRACKKFIDYYVDQVVIGPEKIKTYIKITAIETKNGLCPDANTVESVSRRHRP